MNTTVSNQIIEVLNALCDKFGIAIDWTSQNVLPYVQELMGKAVNYELWTSVVWLLFWSFLIFAFFKPICWYLKNIDNEDNKIMEFIDYNEEIPIVFLIIGIIITIISIIGVITQVMDIITCITFPEKVIYYMVKSMMG